MNRKKYPETPEEIAEALEEWYENGKGGLVRFCEAQHPEAAAQAGLWFEKGLARLRTLTDAIRAL